MDRLRAVVGQQFCSPDEIHLTVVRKNVAVTGGNFMVIAERGNAMFTVKEKLLSLHGRHVFVDAQGHVIITFKKKVNFAFWNLCNISRFCKPGLSLLMVDVECTQKMASFQRRQLRT